MSRTIRFAVHGAPAALTLPFAHAYRRETYAADPCSYCGGEAGVLEHVVPRSAGGGNRILDDNHTAACPHCNAEKGRQGLLQFLARRAGEGRRIGHSARLQAFRRRPGVRVERDRAFILSDAIGDPALSGRALRLLLTLSTIADEDGWCSLNGRQTSRRMNRAPDKISTTARLLEALGYIERHYLVREGRRELVLRLRLSAEDMAAANARAPIVRRVATPLTETT